MQPKGQAEAVVFVVAFGNSQIEQGVAGAATAITATDEGAAKAVLGRRHQVVAVVPVGLGGCGDGFPGSAGHGGNGSSQGASGSGGADKETVSNIGKQKGKNLEEPAAKKKKILRCSICSEEHFTNQCPQLRGPKPSATFCGLAGDGLGFFHIPVDGAKPTIPPDHVSATALVTILEGEVSVELLKSELARILPVKWDWEVHEHGDKAYVVPFP